MNSQKQGLLLVDKAPGFTSFQLVSLLRKKTKERTIGHAGTLDPFATGVMVMLIGRQFTRLSEQFLCSDKQYLATLKLGVVTDTYDLDGQETSSSDFIPSLYQIERALSLFQGETFQVPPMFSAKKIGGEKLCDLARRGVTVERPAVKIRMDIRLICYEYPRLEILVDCSKGTYIRSLAYDLGKALHCGAHLSALVRLKSGLFTIDECISHTLLQDPAFDISPYLRVNILRSIESPAFGMSQSLSIR